MRAWCLIHPAVPIIIWCALSRSHESSISSLRTMGNDNQTRAVFFVSHTLGNLFHFWFLGKFASHIYVVVYLEFTRFFVCTICLRVFGASKAFRRTRMVCCAACQWIGCVVACVKMKTKTGTGDGSCVTQCGFGFGEHLQWNVLSLTVAYWVDDGRE